jgi:hypothetical protein
MRYWIARTATLGSAAFTIRFESRLAGGRKMARKTVFVSDLSGDTIEEGKGAKIRITFDDARRGSYEIDATAEEAAELGRKGRQVARRGRKPKTS